MAAREFHGLPVTGMSRVSFVAASQNPSQRLSEQLLDN